MKVKILGNLSFLLVEKLTFIYIAITMVIVLFLGNFTHAFFHLIANRIVIGSIILALAYVESIKKSEFSRILRYGFIAYLLSVWYPETFEFNRNFINRDYLLAALEQNIFSCQPALLFPLKFPQNWFSEIMNFGYLSYYPIIIGSSVYFYISNKADFKQFFFSLMFSFYIYYLIYILFPTAGPQYYFCALTPDQIQHGIFPNLGNYFNLHTGLVCNHVNDGFFVNLVEKTQLVGERPTAAFPSSHVGISTLIVYSFLRKKKYAILALIFPVYLALVMSTVYIQAHYLIDSIAGFFSAILLYNISVYVYKRVEIKLPRMYFKKAYNQTN
jgi:membrane-associated phospholipid phosphatase